MPAAYFHKTVAARAFKATGKTSEHPNLLYWGAQGPDILLYYGRMRKTTARALEIRGMAGTLHQQKTSEFLTNLLDMAAKGDENRRLYALGFLSHYAVDQVVHPYVYACSVDVRGRLRITPHLMLEARLDSWLWQREGHKGAPRQCEYDVLESELSATADMLAKVYEQTFSPASKQDSLTQTELLTSFHNARKTCSRLYCKNFLDVWKLTLLEVVTLKKPLHIVRHTPLPYRVAEDDMALNVEDEEWFSPWEPKRPRNESVPQLLVNATQLAISYMNAALRYWDGELTREEMQELLGDRSYYSGLDWQKTENPDQIHAPGSQKAEDMKLMRKQQQ